MLTSLFLNHRYKFYPIEHNVNFPIPESPYKFQPIGHNVNFPIPESPDKFHRIEH